MAGSDSQDKMIKRTKEALGDLMLSRGVLKLRGLEIEVLRVGNDHRVRKVTAAEQYTVPEYCEQVIDVFIEIFLEGD